MQRFGRWFLVVIGWVAITAASAACAGVEDEGAPVERREQELQARAESFATGEDEPSVTDVELSELVTAIEPECQMYGDCAYCEGSDWPTASCQRTCYSWYCSPSDRGGNCYTNCDVRLAD